MHTTRKTIHTLILSSHTCTFSRRINFQNASEQYARSQSNAEEENGIYLFITELMVVNHSPPFHVIVSQRNLICIFSIVRDICIVQKFSMNFTWVLVVAVHWRISISHNGENYLFIKEITLFRCCMQIARNSFNVQFGEKPKWQKFYAMIERNNAEFILLFSTRSIRCGLRRHRHRSTTLSPVLNAECRMLMMLPFDKRNIQYWKPFVWIKGTP